MKRLDTFQRSHRVRVTIDGQEVPAYLGETVAGALLAAGHLRFRYDRSGVPRGPFCNMGTCSECMVWLDTGEGFRRRRACLVPVTGDLRVVTREPGHDDD